MADLVADMLVDPGALLDHPLDEGFRLSRAQIEGVQLRSVQQLFEALRPRVTLLDRLASQQGVERIERIEDVVPLLFPHTIYKSYPASWLERCEFQRLTSWLGTLTATDLSHFDHRGLDCIDAWLDRLDESTALRTVHTFGTTGKLSLIPRTRAEWEAGARFAGNVFRDFRAPGGPDFFVEPRPVVHPGYRYGASAGARIMQTIVPLVARDSRNALLLFPEGRFSADIASLAGRLGGASKGGRDAVDIAPALAARRAEFARNERERPERLRRFFAEAIERFRGADVYLFAVWPMLYDWAEEGLQRGVRGVFGPGSILHTGGGTKGRSLPASWRQRVTEFLGFENAYEFYAMTELIPACPRCEYGNYHVPPVLVPFVLDPDTGAMLPRAGRQTGRFAAIDLLARSYWGAIVTGDEVTLAGWNEPCSCGRTGPYVEPAIRRFSEGQGGDDKINCGGAARAHEEALEFLAGQERRLA